MSTASNHQADHGRPGLERGPGLLPPLPIKRTEAWTKDQSDVTSASKNDVRRHGQTGPFRTHSRVNDPNRPDHERGEGDGEANDRYIDPSRSSSTLPTQPQFNEMSIVNSSTPALPAHRALRPDDMDQTFSFETPVPRKFAREPVMLGMRSKTTVQDDNQLAKIDSPFDGLFDNTIAIAQAESPDETPRAPPRRPMPRYPPLNKSASVTATSNSTVSTDKNKIRQREMTTRVSSAPDVVVRPAKHRSSRSVSAWPPPSLALDDTFAYKRNQPVGGNGAAKARVGRSASMAPCEKRYDPRPTPGPTVRLGKRFDDDERFSESLVDFVANDDDSALDDSDEYEPAIHGEDDEDDQDPLDLLGRSADDRRTRDFDDSDSEEDATMDSPYNMGFLLKLGRDGIPVWPRDLSIKDCPAAYKRAMARFQTPLQPGQKWVRLPIGMCCTQCKKWARRGWQPTEGKFNFPMFGCMIIVPSSFNPDIDPTPPVSQGCINCQANPKGSECSLASKGHQDSAKPYASPIDFKRSTKSLRPKKSSSGPAQPSRRQPTVPTSSSVSSSLSNMTRGSSMAPANTGSYAGSFSAYSSRSGRSRASDNGIDPKVLELLIESACTAFDKHQDQTTYTTCEALYASIGGGSRGPRLGVSPVWHMKLGQRIQRGARPEK